MSDGIYKFTDDNFQTGVLDSPDPVLVHFWSREVYLSERVAEVTKRLVVDVNKRIRVGEIEIGKNPFLTSCYAICKIPTIILFHRGCETNRFYGETTEIKMAVQWAVNICSNASRNQPENDSLAQFSTGNWVQSSKTVRNQAECEALHSYLVQTVIELIPALEEMLLANSKPGDGDVNVQVFIQESFWLLGLQLANADREISESESVFIRDVRDLFGSGGYSPSSGTSKEKDETRIRNDPQFYAKVRTPMLVHFLKRYDDEYGTSHSSKGAIPFCVL